MKSHAPYFWQHRIATGLACATLVLVWLGALVTTYDAGMAVPDWPSTYGYNLFLYPWTTWVYGPRGIFVEHGHRLMGAFVGLLTMALSIWTWRFDDRPTLRWFALILLVSVVLQGLLGGARVVQDERFLAMLHGVSGPLFFGLTVAMAAVSYPAWRGSIDSANKGSMRGASKLGNRVVGMTWMLTAIVYVQIVAGANLRHVSVDSSPSYFNAAALMHLALAGGVLAHAAAVVFETVVRRQGGRKLIVLSTVMLAMLLIQVVFGCATWVFRFGWPAWLGGFAFAASHVNSARSGAETLTITSHVVIGSVLLASSILLSLFASRMRMSSATCMIQAGGAS